MLLAKDKYKWPIPGDWWWTIEVGSRDDLQRLKGCYENIIRICEDARYPYPYEIAWESSAHADLKWLVYQSSSVMTGYPKQLAMNLKSPGAMVVQRADDGFVDESLSGFAHALGEAFKTPNIVRHLEKLATAKVYDLG
jgi:hypothetical protein